jgi:hypothetical protein
MFRGGVLSLLTHPLTPSLYLKRRGIILIEMRLGYV